VFDFFEIKIVIFFYQFHNFYQLGNIFQKNRTISTIFRDSKFSRISSLESCLLLKLNTKVLSRSRLEFKTRRDSRNLKSWRHP